MPKEDSNILAGLPDYREVEGIDQEYEAEQQKLRNKLVWWTYITEQAYWQDIYLNNFKQGKFISSKCILLSLVDREEVFKKEFKNIGRHLYPLETHRNILHRSLQALTEGNQDKAKVSSTYLTKQCWY